MLRTSFNALSASRAPTPSASTARVCTSTTLKLRGCRGSAASASPALRFGAKIGSLLGAGFFSTWSSGTICAPVPPRSAALAAALTLTAVLGVALLAAADGIEFTRASPDEWVEHVGLNVLGVSIILHVEVGRRWPFGRVS
jgi:hypothetical protein